MSSKSQVYAEFELLPCEVPAPSDKKQGTSSNIKKMKCRHCDNIFIVSFKH